MKTYLNSKKVILISKLKSNLKKALFTFMIFGFAATVYSQPGNPISPFSIGVKAGWDIPNFDLGTPELDYEGGIQYGLQLDYNSPSRWGARLDYSHFETSPEILLPNAVNIMTTSSSILTQLESSTNSLRRHFLGIGPCYYFGDENLYVLLAITGGYGWANGGDAHSFSQTGGFNQVVVGAIPGRNPLGSNEILSNTGMKEGSFSGKLDIDLRVKLSGNLYLGVGAYVNYINQLQYDDFQDAGPAPGQDNRFAWHLVGDFNSNPTPEVVQWSQAIALDGPQKSVMSYGATIGVNYRFGN